MSPPPAIGITLGDPAGIGPEITTAALESGRLDPRFTYRVIGDPMAATPGRPDAASARAAFDSLEQSVAGLRAGAIAGVVTAPICKETLVGSGFPFVGQTEFFANAFGVADYAMCLTGQSLTVALVTAHEPIYRVSELLTVSGIVRTGRLLAEFLRDRGTARPAVAVAGLNPHAGENGLLGREEQEIITPAVKSLSGIVPWAKISGPHPPDTVFRDAVSGKFDGVLCMYHDQGLIPLKLLDFDSGVNITLGLPHPRTSPDHGTAFGIAGRGAARSASMIAAINLAAAMVAEKLSLAKNRSGST